MPTVLIVDDDETLSELVQEWLMFAGYTVIACNTGHEALERLEMLRFDAIVLDGQLEDMSGIDVLKKYRAAGGGAPVLMLTGSNGVALKEEALAAGANNYVRKPFKLNELTDSLAQLVGENGKKA